MRDLVDLGLIGADNARTRAYVQLLSAEGYRLHTCYIMAEDPSLLEKAAAGYVRAEAPPAYFQPEEPILFTLREASIPYVLISTGSINREDTIEIIQAAEESHLIYSGFGGEIIKKTVFNTGKTFIHVHSGILPQYRGSTTIYYSLLQEGTCGASAIIMTPGLDNGDVIADALFHMPPKGISIDYIYDPFIRAKVLIKAVDSYVKHGAFIGRTQDEQKEVTYFIAHPVLRHIVGLMQDSEGGT